MQDYDESFFIAKANKRASITWFVLLLIASVFYGIKVGRGQLKEAYFAGFFVAGWLSYGIRANVPAHPYAGIYRRRS